jgi:hypothetical protein
MELFYMVSNANIFAQALGTFNDIKRIYEKGGLLSREDGATIRSDTEAMNLSGKILMGGGLVCSIITYKLWSVPYVGPLLSLISSVASLALIVVGHDAYICSNNLKPYSEGKEKFLKSLRGIVSSENETREQFFANLIKAASAGTLLGCIASKKS